jgi:hypothetical protein
MSHIGRFRARGFRCLALTRPCWKPARRYLRAVGPLYGFFGVGLVLYFASQGAGRLLWPVAANIARLAVAAVVAGSQSAGAVDSRASCRVRRCYGVVIAAAIADECANRPGRVALQHGNASAAHP